MALTSFVANVTKITAAWLNKIDVLYVTVFGESATKAAARAALTSDAPMAVGEGGTGATTAGAARTALGLVIGTDIASAGLITASGLTQNTGKLLGRTTASAGAVEEITMGSDMTLAAGALGVAAASDTLAGKIEIATQAEIETASSVNLAVTPGRQQYHPSAAKWWCHCNAAGAISSSYNVTSITDDGIGLLTVTIATDFSSTAWVPFGLAEYNISADVGRFVKLVAAAAAGSGAFACTDTSNTLKDPEKWHVGGFGDQ